MGCDLGQELEPRLATAWVASRATVLVVLMVPKWVQKSAVDWARGLGAATGLESASHWWVGGLGAELGKVQAAGMAEE
jgi:hypothetical protein